MVSTAPPTAMEIRPFEEDAKEVITSFKRAMQDMMDALPVDPEAGPTEVARRLEVDTKLAWKIHHLLDRSDPFEAGRYIPGMAAVRRFLEVTSRLGPPQQLVRALRDACAEFEALVRTHAGSRHSFDLMLAGQAQDEQLRTEKEQRKVAYHTNSFLWGVQAQAQIKTAIMAPSEQEDMIDSVIINGFIGLRRIRDHVPWRMTSSYSIDNEDNVRIELDREPLDPSIAAKGPAGGAPLLTRFCSTPLPELDLLRGRGGALDYVRAKAPLGKSVSETCLIGERLRAVEPRYHRPGYDTNAVYVRMRTPCQVVVLDLLVHQDLFDAPQYEARLFSDLFAGEFFTHHDCDELALHEKVQKLGPGIGAIELPAMPRYREMLRFAFECSGWDSEQYDCYRVSMDYPVTPTDLFMSHPLPEKPA